MCLVYQSYFLSSPASYPLFRGTFKILLSVHNSETQNAPGGAITLRRAVNLLIYAFFRVNNAPAAAAIRTIGAALTYVHSNT